MREIIKQHQENGFGHALREQAIGYTQGHRLSAIDAIEEAICRAVNAHGASKTLPPLPASFSPRRRASMLLTESSPPLPHSKPALRRSATAPPVPRPPEVPTTAPHAVVPPEVPELPAALQTRAALHNELKARTLSHCGGTTALTAAGRAGTVSAQGMGG